MSMQIRRHHPSPSCAAAIKASCLPNSNSLSLQHTRKHTHAVFGGSVSATATGLRQPPKQCHRAFKFPVQNSPCQQQDPISFTVQGAEQDGERGRQRISLSFPFPLKLPRRRPHPLTVTKLRAGRNCLGGWGGDGMMSHDTATSLPAFPSGVARHRRARSHQRHLLQRESCSDCLALLTVLPGGRSVDEVDSYPCSFSFYQGFLRN